MPGGWGEGHVNGSDERMLLVALGATRANTTCRGSCHTQLAASPSSPAETARRLGSSVHSWHRRGRAVPRSGRPSDSREKPMQRACCPRRRWQPPRGTTANSVSSRRQKYPARCLEASSETYCEATGAWELHLSTRARCCAGPESWLRKDVAVLRL